jgi:type I restriction enzyme S subunit
VLAMAKPGPVWRPHTCPRLKPIPFPVTGAPAEQRRIIGALDEIQETVLGLKSSQAQSAAELNALLPSILDKAFKGEL